MTITHTPRVVPFLWFNDQAEAAAKFYTSLFDNSRVVSITRYGEGSPMPKGTAMSVIFDLDGLRIHALNGGPHFELTPAFSMFVNCNTQEEVDFFWTKLGEGGKIMQCGWLTDRFGLTWQVIPVQLGQLLGLPDPAKASRVMQAMMKMVKLDIAGLEAAAR